MKTIKLESLGRKSVEDSIREYAEKIPPGECVRVRDAMVELKKNHPSQIIGVVPDLVIYRYHKNRKNAFLVHPDTAKELRETGQADG